jgi:hypothetical protein
MTPWFRGGAAAVVAALLGAAALGSAPAQAAPDGTGRAERPWQTRAADDLHGYRASAYQGRFFDPRFEQYRLCVLQRESGGYYTVVSSNGLWRGAYQFTQGWASVLLDRLAPEMRATFGVDTWNRLRARLDTRRINQMDRFVQDALFWAGFSMNRGVGLWQSGGNWYCDNSPNGERGWPSKSHYHYTEFEGRPVATVKGGIR